jgi:hypothetical protein
MARSKKIYGYEELNECAFNINLYEIDDFDPTCVDADTGEYHGPGRPDEGAFYVTYGQAKKAVTAFWKNQIQTAKDALKYLRSAKKPTVPR